jgi:hypothetical protein
MHSHKFVGEERKTNRERGRNVGMEGEREGEGERKGTMSRTHVGGKERLKKRERDWN